MTNEELILLGKFVEDLDEITSFAGGFLPVKVTGVDSQLFKISRSNFVKDLPLTPSGNPHVKKWHVDEVGDNGANGAPETPFETLPYAITQASAGDIIICGPGTFGNIIIDKALVIEGLSSDGTDLTTTIGNVTFSNNFVATNTVIRNCIITGTLSMSGSTSFYLILENSNTTILDSSISNIIIKGGKFLSSGGVKTLTLSGAGAGLGIIRNSDVQANIDCVSLDTKATDIIGNIDFDGILNLNNGYLEGDITGIAGTSFLNIYNTTHVGSVIDVDAGKIVINNQFDGIDLNTWYVNPSASGGNGSPTKPFTVDEAMSAASEGDIIFFQAGTYTDDITISKNNLTFVGQSRKICKITVTNFLFDTAAETIFLTLDNLRLLVTNDVTQGINDAFLTLILTWGTFSNDVIIKRLELYRASVSANKIITDSYTLVYWSFVNTSTWTLAGTSSFYHSTINANILATDQTVLLETCKVAGDVDCANLTYNNTVITGTKIGTSSTTVNNQAGTPEHDYKIWHVDGDDGNDSNVGSFDLPVLTAQKAVDLREADGATNAEIRILGGIVSGTVTLASNPSKTTLISGSLRGTAITTINATDTTLRLTNMSVTTLNITQTSSNFMFTLLYSCTILQFNDTIATVGNSTLFAFQGSRLIISVAPSENFDTIFNIEDGSFMDISGGANSTWNKISLINRGTLDIVNSITIATLAAEKSFVNLGVSAALTITTTFDHVGVVFSNFQLIDASAASEDGTPGQFSSPVNFRAESIRTLSSDVISVGPSRNILVAAQTGTADDMIELTGLTIAEKVLLRADTGDTITVKHNDAGATIKILIQDDADFVLDEVHPLELILVATNELVDSRSLTKETIKIPIGARDTDHTTGTNKVGFHIDYNFSFKGLPTLEFDPVITDGGPTGTSFIVDINVADIDGSSLATILSTKLSVDAGGFHSSTAATPVVLSVTTIAQYKFISIDIDQIGGTLAGKGGFVTLNGFRT